MNVNTNERSRSSLSQQLLSTFAVALLAVGATTLGSNYWWVRSSLEQQVDEQANALASSLIFATEGVIEVGYTGIMRRTVQNYATLPAILEVAIVNPDRAVVAHSEAFVRKSLYHRLRPEIEAAIETAISMGKDTDVEVIFEDKSIFVEIFPFRSQLFGSSGRHGVAVLFIDRAEMEKAAHQTFLFSTAIMILGAIAILIVMGWTIRNTAFRPLQRLDRAVDRSKETGVFVIPSQLKTREFTSLATTFKTVFDRLETYDRLQKEIHERRQAELALREKSQQLERTIVELQQAQTQLIQNEKMSSLGQMVAGIAHEINNPVSFIAGNLVHADDYFQDFLRLFAAYQEAYPHPDPKVQNMIDEIDFDFTVEDYQRLLASMKTGSDRIRDIVISLRNFSRLDEAEVKEADIHEGIDSTLLILQHRLKAKPERPTIEVIKNYDRLPLIECYPSQLNQVFMNLLANAIDALEEQVNKQSGFVPKITIHTEFRDRQEQPSPSVTIRIVDNGPGIPPKVQERLFDPFFTTKPIGKGTGLGLSISYQIITDRHQGKLVCHSQPQKGTTFAIEIPTHQARSLGDKIAT